MTTHAAFAYRFVCEDKRAALRGVTLEAGLVLAEQGDAAALDRLRKIRPAAFDRVAFVRVVAIGAAHFSFEHRVMMRQIEFRLHFQMALETGRGRFARVDDRVCAAAAFHVKTSRPVTRFAADVLRVVSLRFQARVRGRREIARNRFVTGRALARPDKFRSGNTRRGKNGAACFEVTARKQNDGERRSAADHPPEFLALTAEPTS